jgi:apolipoprotein N-acyltransferase
MWQIFTEHSWPRLAGKIAIAVFAFTLANAEWDLEGFILGFAWMLCEISKEPTARRAFYSGFITAFLAYAIQLKFFYTLFGPGALILWSVLALFVGLFTLCLHHIRSHWGRVITVIMAAILWMGWEYFRSELYYLRFAWLTLGSTFGDREGIGWMLTLGVYGLSGVIMLLGALVTELPFWCRGGIAGIFGMALTCLAHIGEAHNEGMAWEKVEFSQTDLSKSILREASAETLTLPTLDLHSKKVVLCGIQTEGAMETEMLAALHLAARKHPGAAVLVLSEYAFDGPVPDRIRDWAKAAQRYVIAGGKEPAGNTFENSAYVIGPDGAVHFRQVKNIPIQFFKDGLPATEKKLWESPWGKFGFPICYDLSYSKVCDGYVKQGAQGLITVAMDLMEWGEKAHRLNARMTRIRAAEYNLPIFRLASSGISQCVQPGGRTAKQTPMDDQFNLLLCEMKAGPTGRFPLDRAFCPLSSIISWLVLVVTLLHRREEAIESVNLSELEMAEAKRM